MSYRIWSTSWIRNQERELQRIEADIKAARAEHTSKAVHNSPSSNITADSNNMNFDQVLDMIEIKPLPSNDLNLEKYEKAELYKANSWREIKTEKRAYLNNLIREVVSFEGLVHKDIVLERIRNHYGLKVLRGSTRDKVENHLEACMSSLDLLTNKPKNPLWTEGSTLSKIKGDFVFDEESRLNRPPREAPDDNIYHYYPEDLNHVIVFAAKCAYGISKEDLLTETARILGYSRNGSNIKKVIGKSITRLLDINALIKREDDLIIYDEES